MGKECRDHLGNIYDSKVAMARHYGFSSWSTIRDRLNSGMTLKDALETPVGKNPSNWVNCKDHLGNEYDNITEMCKAWNISKSAYMKRIEKGWSVEKALTTPVTRKIHPISFNGKDYKKLSDLLDEYEITMSQYYSRVKLGWDINDIVDHKGSACFCPCEDHLGNKFDSIKAMCKHYNISKDAYYRRLSYGWSLKKTLTTPMTDTSIHVRDRTFATAKEFCEFCQISTSVYRRFIKAGKTDDEILEAAFNRKNRQSSLFSSKKIEQKREVVKNPRGIHVDHKSVDFGTQTKMLQHYNVSLYAFKKRMGDGWSLKDALETPCISRIDQMKKSRKERINKTFVNNQGLNMTITRYENADDCDVIFDDGYKVSHIRYAEVRNGIVVHPDYPCPQTMMCKKKYEGESYLTRFGLYVTCKEYISSRELKCVFEDGVEVIASSYAWNHDSIVHPYRVNKGESVNEIALRMVLEPFGFKKRHKKTNSKNNFEKFELDLYNEKLKVAIEYDGFNHFISKDKHKDDICHNNNVVLYRIREPQLKEYQTTSRLYGLSTADQLSDELFCVINKIIDDINITVQHADISHIHPVTWEEVKQYMRKNVFLLHIGEEHKHSSGMIMTIIQNEGNQKYTVKFSDGMIVRHKDYNAITCGTVKHPNINSVIARKSNEYVGQRFKMHNGETFIVTEYINGNDCSGHFDNGTELKHIPIARIKNRTLKSCNYKNGKGIDYKKEREGKSVVAKCGMRATIIKYLDANHIVCRFDDGIEVNTSWQHFIRNEVSHPSISTRVLENKAKLVGQEQLMKNGHIAKCIEYIDCHNIIVQFENGLKKKTTTYDFRHGIVGFTKQNVV